MPIKILMPALSPTMTEGNLAKWLKNEGDPVKSGDVIAEIETDKATMEVEAVDEGTLGKILVPGGTEGVKVNEPIALLLEEGEDRERSRMRRRGRPKANGEAKAAPEAQAPDAAGGCERRSRRPRPTPAADRGERIAASPLARRMAAAGRLDLAEPEGQRSARPDRQGRHRGGAQGRSAAGPPCPTAKAGADAGRGTGSRACRRPARARQRPPTTRSRSTTCAR